MKRIKKRGTTDNYGNSKKNSIPNTRPLNQRETKLDVRKGMIRTQETINIHWLEEQKKLFDNI